ncbi:MAG: hypothetical protein JO183_04180, partial [Ktedonobacteraceae bacterium]|nr:hypothetical protein [Ktedonobacteraceae bacterium]
VNSSNGSSSARAPYQNYMPATPSGLNAVNVPKHPTDLARERVLPAQDIDDQDFELDDELEEESEPRVLPMPEPEAQALQRPASGTGQQSQQRPVRRVDRDLLRGNLSPSGSGDVIDIPAFLRKR